MTTSFEIAFDERVMGIFGHISKALGFRMSILDTNYRELAPLDAQPLCAYCRLVQQDLGLLGACRDNDRKHCLEAAAKGRAVSYRCHAGLMETVYPFIIDGECLAYFLVGQFRSSDETAPPIFMSCPPPLRRRLLSTYREQPSFDREKSESALEIIRLLTEYISDNRLISIRQKRLADRLLTLIGDRLSESFTVTEAAAETGRSVSTVNQTLKAFTGMSFKQNQLSIRMETAAKLLLDAPERSVAETAARLGMDDPFYFSRIFKKYRGLSPREYRRKHLRTGEGD